MLCIHEIDKCIVNNIEQYCPLDPPSIPPLKPPFKPPCLPPLSPSLPPSAPPLGPPLKPPFIPPQLPSLPPLPPPKILNFFNKITDTIRNNLDYINININLYIKNLYNIDIN